MWTAFSFGQPSRGATRRRSEIPKFFIARAAAPIFSPNWGRDRMTTGAVICGFDGFAPPRYSLLQQHIRGPMDKIKVANTSSSSMATR